MAAQTGYVWAAILLFPVVGCCRSHLGTLFELAMVGKLHFVSTVTTILILDLTCKIVNMITKFRQFKKISRV